MCVAVPGRVISVEGDSAQVQWGSRVRQAITLFVPDIEVGEFVLVSGGAIVDRLDLDEANARLAVFDAVSELLEEHAGS